MKNIFLLIFLSLILCFNLFCQDLIYKKGKTIQKAQVIEVGTNFIK